MQLHVSLSMDKTLYREKRENDQSKHEINLTKMKGLFLFAGYLDKLKIDPCEIVSQRMEHQSKARQLYSCSNHKLWKHLSCETLGL